ncbi:MAG: hypothetical protein DDT26_01206 [Dehalococcoidia bacterium]|nr:hypothetical protein [Chloroflexota bacterium]
MIGKNEVQIGLILSDQEFILLLRAAGVKGIDREEYIRRALIDSFTRMQGEEAVDLGLPGIPVMQKDGNTDNPVEAVGKARRAKAGGD